MWFWAAMFLGGVYVGAEAPTRSLRLKPWVALSRMSVLRTLAPPGDSVTTGKESRSFDSALCASLRMTRCVGGVASLADVEGYFADEAVACGGPHDGGFYGCAAAGAGDDGVGLAGGAGGHAGAAVGFDFERGVAVVAEAGAEDLDVSVEVCGDFDLDLAGAAEQEDAGDGERDGSL